MLKKITKTLLVSTFIFSAVSSAQAAEPGVYAKGTLQYIFSNTEESKDSSGNIDNHYQPGAGFSAGMGGTFDAFRLEGEAVYLSTNIDGFSSSAGSGSLDTDVKVFAGMVNGYYDFKNSSPVTPYIGAGVGIANVEFSAPGLQTDSTNAFAYQALAGVNYNIDQHNAISLGYRYFATETVELPGVETSFGKNIVEVGYKYSF